MDIEIAIVGASSAGLFAAERMARAGRRVAVFERQAALNHARRTYIITPQIRRILGVVPESALLHHTAQLELIAGSAAATITLHDPDLIIERNELIRRLAEQAEQAGAQICFGHRMTSLTSDSTGTALLHMNRRNDEPITVRAGAVIGADGVFSDVAVAAGIPRPPVVQIVQAEVALPPGYNPQLTKVWFAPHDTRYFYWLIPESATHGVLGLIADDGTPIRPLLDHFLEREGMQATAYQASHVAMHHPSLRPWGRIGRTPVYLVGDAGGQVKVTTVGGNVTGFYGAEAATRCVLEGIAPQQAFAAVKRELDLHWWMRRLLERFDEAGYARLIAQMSPAIRGFLAQHNRDAMAGTIWRAPLLRPKLLGLGLEALLRPAMNPPLLQPIAGTAITDTAYRSPAD